MLRIRLTRVGKRKQPAYRLVVTDRRNPRDGAHLEIVGHYNPLTNPATITLKEERLVHWLQHGAQPSETAAKILTKAGIMEMAGRAPFVYKGKDVAPVDKKAKKGGDEAPAPVASAAPAAVAVAEAPAAEAEATPEPEAAAEPETPADDAPAAEAEAAE